MTKKEFIRSAVYRGYATYAEARDFCNRHPQPEYDNCRLYLTAIFNTIPPLQRVLETKFSGMPGFIPAQSDVQLIDSTPPEGAQTMTLHMNDARRFTPDDDYDPCEDCTGYGDDYSIDDDGELVCNCDDCSCNQNKR